MYVESLLRSVIIFHSYDAVRRENQYLRWFLPGADSDRHRADELDLQGVHVDMQEIWGMVLPVSRHPGRRRRRRRRCLETTYHAQADRACFAVRFLDRQGWLENQGDSRGHRCVYSSRFRDAAQLDRTCSDHIRYQRSNHAVHISYLLRYARGTYHGPATSRWSAKIVEISLWFVFSSSLLKKRCYLPHK